MLEIWTLVAVSVPAMLLLGFRHAFDIDHVTAIDNLVRLHHSSKRSRWIGSAFSFGHMISVTCEMLFIILIVGSVTSTNQIAFFGGLIGIISLSLIGVINIYSMKKWGKTGSAILSNKVIKQTGILGPFGSSLITGIVFGLGFDTATQISALTISAVTSVIIGVQAALVLTVFFAIGLITLDSLNSRILSSIFSRIMNKKGFRPLSYSLSGVALIIASIATFEIISKTEILPEWVGPSLTGGVIATSFLYSFLTHT